jgi:hypothetical protein
MNGILRWLGGENHPAPRVINTDKHAGYPPAIVQLKAEDALKENCRPHVLPDGFQRIRYYGFLGNRYREQKLAHCRKLLGMPSPEPPALATAKDYRERYEELTASSLWQRPVCHQGHMLVIEILPRNHIRQMAITDTS